MARAVVVSSSEGRERGRRGVEPKFREGDAAGDHLAVAVVVGVGGGGVM
jgi:hypothetical protein